MIKEIAEDAGGFHEFLTLLRRDVNDKRGIDGERLDLSSSGRRGRNRSLADEVDLVACQRNRDVGNAARLNRLAIVAFERNGNQRRIGLAGCREDHAISRGGDRQLRRRERDAVGDAANPEIRIVGIKTQRLGRVRLFLVLLFSFGRRVSRGDYRLVPFDRIDGLALFRCLRGLLEILLELIGPQRIERLVECECVHLVLIVLFGAFALEE